MKNRLLCINCSRRSPILSEVVRILFSSYYLFSWSFLYGLGLLNGIVSPIISCHDCLELAQLYTYYHAFSSTVATACVTPGAVTQSSAIIFRCNASDPIVNQYTAQGNEACVDVSLASNVSIPLLADMNALGSVVSIWLLRDPLSFWCILMTLLYPFSPTLLGWFLFLLFGHGIRVNSAMFQP